MLASMKTVLLFSFSALFAVDLPKDEVVLRSDQDQMQGTWKVEKIEYGGMAAPGKEDKMSLVIRDNRMTPHRDGKKEEDEMSFTLEADKQPATIDLKSTRIKEMTIRGIYRIDGDTLTLCLSPQGGRPTKFESKQNTDVVLIVLKRERK
jgi:uncharacterized protein (TIGR03067 family)